MRADDRTRAARAAVRVGLGRVLERARCPGLPALHGVRDADPDLAGAQSLAALIYTLTARLVRAHDEAEPVELLPNRLIEENLWRAIRYGLSGELIDLTTGDVRPARAHIERLLEWVAPVADELGTAHLLAVPAANAAERQRARLAEGTSIRDIFAEQVAAGEPVGG